MARVLLVHGAWHGPWCWDRFAERLAGHGHQVQAVRLRGHDRPPGRIWHRIHHYVEDVGQARELFFTPDTPQALVDDTFGRLQDESWPAFIDTVVVWPRPRRVQVPVLVLGAEHDGLFTVGEMRRTAAAYRTQAEIVPGIGHDMMLDQGWPEVADRIHTWIREPLPSPRLRLPPVMKRCSWSNSRGAWQLRRDVARSSR
jgi:alpha-beta hydrolase superfamily lysophospholipase